MENNKSGKEIKRAVFILFGMMLLLALGACAPTTPTSLVTLPVLAVNGRFDVGGYGLYVTCRGTGSPAVVLDAELGQYSNTWLLVQPEVAQFTRVCSYDRAGLGLSDAGPLPRTSKQIATELHTLLLHVGLQPPYVMVGHSFGALNIRMYASEYPGEVAGMVMIEATHEDWESRLSELFTADEFERVMALYVNNIEGVDFEKSNEQIRTTGSLDAMPLRILTSTGRYGITELDEINMELQADLVELSTNSRQIIAQHSGQALPFEQPVLVVDAIRQVVDEIRE